MSEWPPIVELRQYTLVPGQREVLIELFDREFVDTQEAVGMRVIGQFRDLDRPDRFVWLRGFADMESRRVGLETFYGGPVWKAHAPAARVTMIDTDDVLLLRPVAPHLDTGERGAGSWFAVTICSLDGLADPGEIERALAALLLPAPLAAFVEEPSENTFPALPVRAGEHVLVWIQRAANLATSAAVAQAMLSNLVGTPGQLRLEPTPGSRLR